MLMLNICSVNVSGCFCRPLQQGRPSHGGNEAEIFIILILGGKFGILGGNKMFLSI